LTSIHGRNSNAIGAGRPSQNDFSGGCFLSGTKLQGVGEFFRRDTCHFQRTPQRAKGNFPVHGDDATAFAFGRDFFEDNMAAALAVNEESESFQTFTASVPDTMGSLAMSSSKVYRRWLPDGLRE
jgi:hypothetical protein